MTYRHTGHSRTDPATYRPKEEVERWLARDPIKTLERDLLHNGTAESRLDEIRNTAEQEVRDALERALSWPAPELETRFEHVYA
jgi:TPP-dependent pyruvate/acetoin dehydrogenase alpha subunit